MDKQNKRTGRPPTGLPRMVRVTVTLPPDLVARLKEAGGGNVSQGIRKALEAMG